MEGLLSVLILTVLGNIISEYYQNWLNHRREDRKRLLQTLNTLLKIKPYLVEYYPPPSPELDELCRELLLSASGVHTKNYRGLADKLVEFARKADKRTDELIELFQQVAAKVSKPLDRFHRKQNKLFAKALEELRKVSVKDHVEVGEETKVEVEEGEESKK